MSLLTTMLESVGTLKRPTINRDQAGGVTQDPFKTTRTAPPPTIIVQDVPCSIQPASAHIQQIYAQQGMNVTTTIFFADDIQARPNDLFFAEDLNGNMHRFKVLGFNSNLFGRYNVPYQMNCEELV